MSCFKSQVAISAVEYFGWGKVFVRKSHILQVCRLRVSRGSQTFVNDIQHSKYIRHGPRCHFLDACLLTNERNRHLLGDPASSNDTADSLQRPYQFIDTLLAKDAKCSSTMVREMNGREEITCGYLPPTSLPGKRDKGRRNGMRTIHSQKLAYQIWVQNLNCTDNGHDLCKCMNLAATLNMSHYHFYHCQRFSHHQTWITI